MAKMKFTMMLAIIYVRFQNLLGSSRIVITTQIHGQNLEIIMNNQVILLKTQISQGISSEVSIILKLQRLKHIWFNDPTEIVGIFF